MPKQPLVAPVTATHASLEAVEMKHLISKLTFVVETETVTEEIRSNQPFMRVHVIPLIDGQPYIADYKR